MMRESSTVPEDVKQRLNWLLVFIIICLVILVISLWYLQMIKGGELKKRAVENCIRSLVEDAPRGKIYDRQGELLVTNRPTVLVSIIPAEVEDLKGLSDKLSRIIDLPPESIEKKVKNYSENPFKPVKILDDCKTDKIIEIEERKDELKGVVLEVKPRRNYLYQDLAAHSLGYVGEINKEELQQLGNSKFQGGDIIGKSGLEKYYNDILGGEKGGREVEIDALGQEIATLLYREPIPGQDIVLTIDKNLQLYGESLLDGKKGSILVSNPYTGEILALVNKPSFNPNLFADGISYADWQRISSDPDYPLTNRSVQGVYSPGSIFKVVIVIAALEEGVTDRKRKIYCSGTYKLADKVFTCWKKSGHGSLNVIDAIANSCNVYFYTIGNELGIERLNKYIRKFGLGEKVGIDLPSEAIGTIPSAEWKEREFKQIWFPGDTINLSIGQGYLLLTPLQIHSVICAITTEGRIYRLHLVKKIISPDGKIVKEIEPEIYKKVDISSPSFQTTKEGLRETILKGTGWRANVKELSIAGKTGTAQNPQGETHAWFIGFAPYENPEVCITVFLENGGEGGEVAAPIARAMLEKYFKIQE
ncbi:MAG: penicillin-binding protein 2 [Candidatus Infernicultor aquiphilus]|uniref:Penicillin-binding protein 2 n=1 Tax=Candidatus Infernicultor aquiphilus TaxID=1805029 RepID=A0A2M7PKU1_9BACT|nr:penicillin-binding protein 2 [bacterium]PIU25672.1 MAG: penicillin-binding protein 2 [Candidatus Atribacteria bacterium CG08_land_8_20_14_0_20_33_29]PIW11637.1 MAG: penicillin-binding protein 2 [Candidatus Atribacteria bacterium CG17_big_fil_post_rev_8_21_14_2_50_34_11]PIX34387.1 MAG: penicillin-binding protein 2 [Candidatus Atribacteria bacterium CG_4_8_14_3_um_filter_34_18]PIY31250.1 MAG: penicillin-binding protein 2 [Candidatus Atribacteria bacterium CG_4_10_14_3_um_filter_34_13]PJB56312